MTEPERLLASTDADGTFARTLLRAEATDPAHTERAARLLAVLGIPAGPAGGDPTPDDGGGDPGASGGESGGSSTDGGGSDATSAEGGDSGGGSADGGGSGATSTEGGDSGADAGGDATSAEAPGDATGVQAQGGDNAAGGELGDSGQASSGGEGLAPDVGSAGGGSFGGAPTLTPAAKLGALVLTGAVAVGTAIVMWPQPITRPLERATALPSAVFVVPAEAPPATAPLPAVPTAATPSAAHGAPTPPTASTSAPARPAASTSAAGGAAPPPTAKAPSLADEIRALDRARSALRRGDRVAARSALNDYFARFPRGTLAPEARALSTQLEKK